MFSLAKVMLPSSITVDGTSYSIKTDFHWWLTLYHQIKNNEIEKITDIDYIYSGKKPSDRMKGYEELLKFLNPERTLPRATGKPSSGVVVYDYDIDSEIIYSSFMEQYGIDLFESRLHWWKFLALFDGLHNTRFNEIVSYRCYEKNNKQSSEDVMEELKRIWTIEPEEDTDKVQKDLEEFNSLFG